MTLCADASFLVSLYGGDINTPTARAWMAATAEPILASTALRFETENALRLACFRKTITPKELRTALGEIENDIADGILIVRDIPAARHWAECRRLSAVHTEASGFGAFDILHVAGALLCKADTFATFDGKQGTLAKAVGLALVPAAP